MKINVKYFLKLKSSKIYFFNKQIVFCLLLYCYNPNKLFKDIHSF